MEYKERYLEWVEKATEDVELTEELLRIQADGEAVEDRFYRDLAFGTGGLRGVIGAGTNRMNVYTVARASQGLSAYLHSQAENPSIAIAYDSRKNSQVFAQKAAGVFAANGIRVHIFRKLAPTPMLSFAVRKLKCTAGIVVTASHNPAKDNGYKVYNSDGCQITLEAAQAITARIAELGYFSGIQVQSVAAAQESGLLKYIDEAVVEAYFACVREQSLYPKVRHSGLTVAYTPLNGAGNQPVRRILQEVGVDNLYVVAEQEQPDSSFTTCPFPNPEYKEALALGIALGGRVEADIVLGTDPDCDRVGAAVLHDGNYVLINGNQMGALLLDFICEMRKLHGNMPSAPVAVKTIVTSELVQAVADGHGVQMRNVLTGFKFIGELIGDMERQGKVESFLFGLEESYGYLAGSYVRDKDAVVASMLICEMAAFYKRRDKTLVDALRKLYRQCGYYFDKLDSTAYEGAQGMQDMEAIMEALRTNPPTSVAGVAVAEVGDYLHGVKRTAKGEQATGLPRSNVLGLLLEDGSSVIVRPSGTEPKLKVYYSLRGDSMEHCESMYTAAAQDMGGRLHR